MVLFELPVKSVGIPAMSHVMMTKSVCCSSRLYWATFLCLVALSNLAVPSYYNKQ